MFLPFYLKQKEKKKRNKNKQHKKQHLHFVYYTVAGVDTRI